MQRKPVQPVDHAQDRCPGRRPRGELGDVDRNRVDQVWSDSQQRSEVVV
jgi:hypothetical protein